MSFKDFLRKLTPPLIWEAVKKIKGSPAPDWSYVGMEFPVQEMGTGWHEEAIVRLQKSRLADWIERCGSTLPFGKGVEGGTGGFDLSLHNTLMSFSSAFSRAAMNKASVRLLDWGGGLGQYAYLCRALYPNLRLDYHCYDLPAFCEAARENLPKDRFSSDADGMLAEKYDFALVSSSLWYDIEWKKTFSRLAQAADYLYFTRQFVVFKSPGFVARQDARNIGYPSPYCCWILNRDEVLEVAEKAGLELLREFYIHPGPRVHGAPEQVQCYGWLWRRKGVGA